MKSLELLHDPEELPLCEANGEQDEPKGDSKASKDHSNKREKQSYGHVVLLRTVMQEGLLQLGLRLHAGQPFLLGMHQEGQSCDGTVKRGFWVRCMLWVHLLDAPQGIGCACHTDDKAHDDRREVCCGRLL